MPKVVRRLLENWEFIKEHIRLGVWTSICGVSLLLVLGIGKLWVPNLIGSTVSQILLSLGTGTIIVGMFNVIYEFQTREKFNQMLSMVNKSIVAGAIVHPSHMNILSRKDSIEQYFSPNETIRIMTSTADNYIKNGEEPRYILEKKITDNGCKVKVLLHLPLGVFPHDNRIGIRGNSPQQLINEQRVLFDDYQSLIACNPARVGIKFFTSPLYCNYIIIGNSRIFVAPIFHSISSRDLPCYEIFPAGPRSLFHKYLNDFDYIYDTTDKRFCMDFVDVKKLYEENGFDQIKINEKFLALGD